uniref:Uncharacterized protein n=1 Tax=Aegilops tauschii TaxID=37682 RepID=M8D5Q6_AEGTA
MRLAEGGGTAEAGGPLKAAGRGRGDHASIYAGGAGPKAGPQPVTQCSWASAHATAQSGSCPAAFVEHPLVHPTAAVAHPITQVTRELTLARPSPASASPAAAAPTMSRRSITAALVNGSNYEAHI